MPYRVLLTGGSGALGRSLLQFLSNDVNTFTVKAPTHQELDIVDRKEVNKYISAFVPDVIIHTAAITSVPKCESNPILAHRVNVMGTQNLVRALNDTSIFDRINLAPKFVYIGTPCIFDGERGNYSEDDLPDPKNFYGYTKMLAEEVVRENIKDFLIARVNFKPMEPWAYPKAFSDRFGTYLFANDVAKILVGLIKEDKLFGIVHITGDRRISMWELARIVSPKIEPMTLQDYKGPPLTRDMTLISKRLPSYRLGMV